MENKDLLKMAVEGQKLSKADKTELRAMFAQYGVKVNKSGCSNCWADAAAEYMAAARADANVHMVEAKQKTKEAEYVLKEGTQIESKEAVTEEQKPAPRYKLKAGTCVRFLGMLITEETINDAFAKRLLSLGFPKTFFV